MFYAEVVKDFFICFPLFYNVFRIHPFFFLLHLILFCAVSEIIVRKGPIDVHV